jgi:hypothetical protein
MFRDNPSLGFLIGGVWMIFVALAARRTFRGEPKHPPSNWSATSIQERFWPKFWPWLLGFGVVFVLLGGAGTLGLID